MKVNNSNQEESKTNQLLRMAELNNGTITSSFATSYGYSRGLLRYLLRKGDLENPSRGVYILPDFLEDDFALSQARFKKGIYSLETALYLLDLTDRTPARFNMSFPIGYNLTNPKKQGIIAKTTKKEWHGIGIIEVETPFGNKVKCYSPERTLCDILRPGNKVEQDTIISAFKSYAFSLKKGTDVLLRYAKIFNVEEKVRNYIQMLM